MEYAKLRIYHRKDGRVEGRYIKGYDAEGKAQHSSVYGKSDEEVEYKYKVLCSEGNVSEPKERHKMSVYQWIVNDLEKRKTQIKASTACIYERYLKNHIKHYFSEIELYKFDADQMQNFINMKIEDGLSVRTVQSIFVFIKASMREAIENDIIRDFFKKITVPKIRNKDTRVFTIAEQKRLEAIVGNSTEPHKVGILISLYTGIRIGELCGLMWDDIDFDSKLLHIRRTMQRIKSEPGMGHKTRLVLLPPKTESSYRDIPLPQFLVDVLIRFKAESISPHIMAYGEKLIEPRNLQYNFKKIIEEAEISDANYHALRHTFATRALEDVYCKG